MTAAALESGADVPLLPEQPKIYSWLLETYQAFWRLSKQRGEGFSGPLKIGASDIMLYQAEFEPYEDALEFYDMITAMDATYIERALKALEEKRKLAEQQAGRR